MSAADAGNYITLRGLCEYISVSPATGRNWLKMGKITPQIEKNGAPLFTQEYVSRLKKDLLTGKSTLLKSRRNKKYVTGSSIYESYITAASANIPKVQQLMEMVCSQGTVSYTHLIWLWNVHLKSFKGFSLNPFGIFFKHIEQAVWIIVSISVIYNRNLYRLDMKCPDISPFRIFTYFHTNLRLSARTLKSADSDLPHAAHDLPKAEV